MPVRGILTDIEGTTTSIAFVADVLFPYARRAMPQFVAGHAHEPRVRALLEETRDLAGLDENATDAALAAVLCDWIDQDRKVAPLKSLQGLIWADGYAGRAFVGHVYPDAVAALRQWHRDGLALYVFSSGSVAAQQLLFRHSDAGDLTPLFSGYFDTRTGAKRDPAAYRAIAQAISMKTDALLFLSDLVEELDAASEAGLRTVLVDRAERFKEGADHPRVGHLTEVRP
ncbi:MAG: acireductone synthase [Acidiferrobacteraceae bacterium]